MIHSIIGDYDNFSGYVENIRKENDYKSVLHVMNNPDFYKDKINLYIDKYYPYYYTNKKFVLDSIIDSCKNSFEVASLFAKNSSRQNFTEILVNDLFSFDSGFVKLPAGGSSCIRFDDNGDIFSQNLNRFSKSADFSYTKDGILYYITQKYTMSAGGSQDNQYRDVIDFLNKGSKKHQVIALVDGNYWYSKINDLRKQYVDNKNVHVLTVFDFASFINNVQE